MVNNLMAPPIRTGLINNPDGTPLTQTGSSDGSGSSSGTPLQTEKTWYYYWRELGRKINQGTEKLDKLVTYGAHADRGDPANMPDGALYVETDRGVIYANEGGVWQYVAGTMWDTLSPNNRPTDLDAHDAGFDFRTTEQPAREFIWSQTEWIEATPVRYGTHAQRLSVVVAEVIDQMLWVETDRGAIYQLQNGTTWQYLAGVMWGTLVPDQRPTDLGTHDAGFDFRTTDAPPREFIWSQTAWIETGAANSAQIVQLAAAFTLPTAAANVPGLSLTLPLAGRYYITALFQFSGSGAGDAYVNGLGQLVANGAAQPGLAVYGYLCISGTGLGLNPTTFTFPTFQQWIYQASTPGQVIQIQAWKGAGGTGTSVLNTQSTLSALYVSP